MFGKHHDQTDTKLNDHWTWKDPITPYKLVFTSGVHWIWKWEMKWRATATSASRGQRENQSMVHPDMRPGNFMDLDRNFSPTWCEGMKWKLELLRKFGVLRKYACKNWKSSAKLSERNWSHQSLHRLKTSLLLLFWKTFWVSTKVWGFGPDWLKALM